MSIKLGESRSENNIDLLRWLLINLSLVIGLVYNKTHTRGELTAYKPNDVPYYNQLVLGGVDHQVCMLVNLPLKN